MVGQINTDELTVYKDLLLKAKAKILNGGLWRDQEDLAISPDDLPDEADLATNVINQQVSFSIRKREIDKLRAIDEALMRIEDGSYGLCEECGESIGAKRLQNQPWTTLCITHAEEAERETAKFSRFA